jgi:hypothetical protein
MTCKHVCACLLISISWALGGLGDWIMNLTSLVQLQLDDNIGLGGHIPAGIGGLFKLIVFYFAGTRFEGLVSCY